MIFQIPWSRQNGRLYRDGLASLPPQEPGTLATAAGTAGPPARPGDDAALRRLLVLCLRSRSQPDALDQARALARSPAVDWAGFVNMSHREGVAPLLYQATRGQGLLPPEVEQRLRSWWQAWGPWNAATMVQLECILGQLYAADIPVILLKGAALLETVYRGSPVRPMCDVDLLLRPAAVARAADLLAAHGFVPDPRHARQDASRDYDFEIIFRRSGPLDSLVDLHWHLFGSRHHQAHLPIDWFWETARPCQVGQAAAQVLSPEALLLHLCGHLWLHHRAQTSLLREHDIVEVIVGYGNAIDWDLVLALAGRCDLVLPLQALLPALARDWGAPVPSDVICAVNALVPTAAERLALARLVVAERSFAGAFWIDLAATAGWRTRLARAWGNLFPSPAYIRRRYEVRRPLLVPFYYPYRWYLALRSLGALRTALCPGNHRVLPGKDCS